MQRIIVILLLFLSGWAFGQSLTSLNINYLYDPQNEITMQLKPVRLQSGIDVYYEFKTQQTEYSAEGYTITWEKRSTYTQRNAEEITPEMHDEENTSAIKKGWLKFPLPDKTWWLLARVKNNATGKNWTFSAVVNPKYPVNGYLENQGQVVIHPFIETKKEYVVKGSGGEKPLSVFYYKEKFPAGSPPFAEKQATADRFLFADSTFTIKSGSSIVFKKEGLYLVQEDTTAAEGFTFRASSQSYPKYTRMEDLTAPMVFITTNEEYDQLVAARDEKAKFDKIILDITGDKDRAKNFIRSYFRRIELANQYFTSYKEGWKTDRGMVYLVFGVPTEVSRNEGNEIWYYKNFQTRFTFVKSGSVYDPDTYVLLRDKRYAETWYNTIDLWRKSRF